MRDTNCDPRLDEMRDPVDRASLEWETDRQHALAAARGKSPQPVDPETLIAEDYICADEGCEEEIPPVRRHNGYRLCVDCAERHGG